MINHVTVVFDTPLVSTLIVAHACNSVVVMTMLLCSKKIYQLYREFSLKKKAMSYKLKHVYIIVDYGCYHYS